MSTRLSTTRRWALLGAALVLAASACSTASGNGGGSTTSGSSASSPADPDRYVKAIDAAHARGLDVWLEADLVKRWQAGPATFNAGIDQLAVLATRPGVQGIKVADELGYGDGLDNEPERALQFLRDTRHALATAAPNAKILVDFVVPALGCAGTLADSCRQSAESAHPAITPARLDEIFAEHLIDVADISTGLLDETTYEQGGTTADDAQRAAWAEIQRRGWGHNVLLQARKALAHPGEYGKPRSEAEAMVGRFVDIPLESGAAAVDVWTWRQMYQGDVVRLMDPGMRPNALWRALVERHDKGDRLFTHFTPSNVERDVGADLDVISQAFTSVFVAAGIG